MLFGTGSDDAEMDDCPSKARRYASGRNTTRWRNDADDLKSLRRETGASCVLEVSHPDEKIANSFGCGHLSLSVHHLRRGGRRRTAHTPSNRVPLALRVERRPAPSLGTCRGAEQRREMGNKKPPPKKSDEEKLAERVAKANANLLKAAKNDETAKAEKAIADGAELNFANEHGQTAAHMAAAYGALDIIRFLHKAGADFTLQNKKKMTALDAAKHIGEEDAQALIEALLDGRSGDDIGLGKDLDLSDDDEAAGADADGSEAKAKAKAAAPEAAAAPMAVDVSDDAAKAKPGSVQAAAGAQPVAANGA